VSAVTPISQLARRIPEAGRIRMGEKGGKGQPVAIGDFRFTSHDRVALGQIADMYGGTVTPWSDPKAAEGQWEVRTTAPEIRVVLPPDPLGGSPIYELWGGGGCDRRCDGETAQIVTRGPEGPELADVPCICNAKGAMECKVKTRLSVILPEARFAGVWRLDTSSWNAAQELPGMVDMIQAAQARGLPYATLAIKHRRSVQAGQTRKFLVPVLGVAESIEGLMAGAANVTGRLPEGGPEQAALHAGDDEVIEAELVDDVIPGAAAEHITALLNAGGNDAIRAWRDRFGCPPAELPADRLGEAEDFVSDLEAAEASA